MEFIEGSRGQIDAGKGVIGEGQFPLAVHEPQIGKRNVREGVRAHVGDRLRQIQGADGRAVERFSVDSDQRRVLRQSHRIQRFAPEEHALLSRKNGRRGDGGRIRLLFGKTVADGKERLRENDALQRDVIGKRTVANGGYAFRQHDVFQRGKPAKNALSHDGRTVRDDRQLGKGRRDIVGLALFDVRNGIGKRRLSEQFFHRFCGADGQRSDQRTAEQDSLAHFASGV